MQTVSYLKGREEDVADSSCITEHAGVCFSLPLEAILRSES